MGFWGGGFGWPCFGLDGRLFFCVASCMLVWISVGDAIFGFESLWFSALFFFVLTFSVCNTHVFFKIIFVHHWSSVSE